MFGGGLILNSCGLLCPCICAACLVVCWLDFMLPPWLRAHILWRSRCLRTGTYVCVMRGYLRVNEATGLVCTVVHVNFGMYGYVAVFTYISVALRFPRFSPTATLWC
jgi:predicted MFS family arabinose efflux permease